MDKISVKQANHHIIVSNRLSHPEEVNDRECHIISTGKVEGLLPVIIMAEKDEIILKSVIADLVSLQSYCEDRISKQLFLSIVRQMLHVIKICTQNFLNPNNIFLDLNYIFIDPKRQAIKCILWPVLNSHIQQSPTTFLKELPGLLHLTDHPDHDYMAKYLQFFSSDTSFSMSAFTRFVFGISVASSHSNSPDTSRKSRRSTAHTIDNDPNIGKKTQDHSPVDASQHKKTSKHPSSGDAVTTASPKNKPDQQIPIIAVAHHKRKTAAIYPYLIREKNKQIVFVNKSCFRIGKEKREVDFHISDNSAISRKHADIVTRDGQYFIIDHDSTNKTRVQDYLIPPEQEFEIFPNNKLCLANEEFTFYIL